MPLASCFAPSHVSGSVMTGFEALATQRHPG